MNNLINQVCKNSKIATNAFRFALFASTCDLVTCFFCQIERFPGKNFYYNSLRPRFSVQMYFMLFFRVLGNVISKNLVQRKHENLAQPDLESSVIIDLRY